MFEIYIFLTIFEKCTNISSIGSMFLQWLYWKILWPATKASMCLVFSVKYRPSFNLLTEVMFMYMLLSKNQYRDSNLLISRVTALLFKYTNRDQIRGIFDQVCANKLRCLYREQKVILGVLNLPARPRFEAGQCITFFFSWAWGRPVSCPWKILCLSISMDLFTPLVITYLMQWCGMSSVIWPPAFGPIGSHVLCMRPL